jgi:cell division septal protein FtsQ
VKRLLLATAVVLVAAIAIYWFAFRDKTVEATVEVPKLAAVIGSGEDAVLVAADGQILRWGRRPEHLHLPTLPLDQPPKGGRVKGPVREQAEVLGAVPTALRRFVAGSHYGDSGVDVELTSGIELRFGDASQAERKWKAAAAVLADRSISALDYVNLQSPSHPSTGGEGHLLPE